MSQCFVDGVQLLNGVNRIIIRKTNLDPFPSQNDKLHKYFKPLYSTIGIYYFSRLLYPMRPTVNCNTFMSRYEVAILLNNESVPIATVITDRIG